MSNVEFGAIKPSCLDGVKYSLASKERTILLCDEVTQECSRSNVLSIPL